MPKTVRTLQPDEGFKDVTTNNKGTVTSECHHYVCDLAFRFYPQSFVAS